ncbi:unnamed protein product [Phaeothamnion confervicola]
MEKKKARRSRPRRGPPLWPRVLATIKPVVHYGFVPLVIWLGMQTDPRPAWSDLIPFLR